MSVRGEERVRTAVVLIAFLSAGPVEACESAFDTDSYSEGFMLDIIRVDPEWVPVDEVDGVPGAAPWRYEAAGLGSLRGGGSETTDWASIFRAGDWTP